MELSPEKVKKLKLIGYAGTYTTVIINYLGIFIPANSPEDKFFALLNLMSNVFIGIPSLTLLFILFLFRKKD